MLACDLLMNVRASRTISDDQMVQLERLVFGRGVPSRDQIDLLVLIDTYLRRPHPGWTELLARAVPAALVPAGAEDRASPVSLARAA